MTDLNWAWHWTDDERGFERFIRGEGPSARWERTQPDSSTLTIVWWFPND